MEGDDEPVLGSPLSKVSRRPLVVSLLPLPTQKSLVSTGPRSQPASHTYRQTQRRLLPGGKDLQVVGGTKPHVPAGGIWGGVGGVGGCEGGGASGAGEAGGGEIGGCDGGGGGCDGGDGD